MQGQVLFYESYMSACMPLIFPPTFTSSSPNLISEFFLNLFFHLCDFESFAEVPSVRSLTDRARRRRDIEVLSASAHFRGASFSPSIGRRRTRVPRPRRHRAAIIARVNARNGTGEHGQQRGGHDLIVADVNTGPNPPSSSSLFPLTSSNRCEFVHRVLCKTCHFLKNHNNDGIT